MTTMTTTDTPRIYVACLAAYNNGRLHGTWIDLADVDGIDELWDRVNAMLKASPEPGAEEWAIHDYEGFGDWRVSEYESFAHVLLVADLIDAHGEEAAAFVANDDSVLRDATFGDVEAAFHESYSGTFASEREYTEALVDDIGLPNVGPIRVPSLRGDGEKLSDALGPYLDWDALTGWATEDVWTAKVSDGVAVFRSC